MEKAGLHPADALMSRFEAARAAVRAHHTDDSSDSTLNARVADQDRLAFELARLPCATDEEFFARAAYLLEWETANAGHAPTMKNDFGAVLVAFTERLKQRGQKCWPPSRSLSRLIALSWTALISTISRKFARSRRTAS